MATKYTKLQRLRRAIGTRCPYCERTILFDSFDPSRTPSRDHHYPRSRGGQQVVWCCEACNQAKGDMTPEEWAAFRAANPMWWEHQP